MFFMDAAAKWFIYFTFRLLYFFNDHQNPTRMLLLLFIQILSISQNDILTHL